MIRRGVIKDHGRRQFLKDLPVIRCLLDRGRNRHETLKKLLDEVCKTLHRLGGLMEANDWDSGVILKGKMEVARTRRKMFYCLGLCVADVECSKC